MVCAILLPLKCKVKDTLENILIQNNEESFPTITTLNCKGKLRELKAFGAFSFTKLTQTNKIMKTLPVHFHTMLLFNFNHGMNTLACGFRALF